MDTKKNMSREQLLAYMRDNCTEAEAQQVRMWLRERLKDPGLDQLFSDLLDATETEYDPEGKERVRRKLDSILAACPAPNSPPRSGNFRRWRWSLRIIEYAAAVAAVVLALHYRHQANTPREWVEVYAGMGERREIVLPDSTHVWLNAGTKLIYPKQFNRSMRQVYLSGENLFTHSPMFKHTDMFAPEVITSGDSDFAASTTSGLNGTGNGYSYPMLKTVTLGINVTF